jgi:membrane protease subunit HflK
MAGENVPADEKVRRSVARTLGNGVFYLTALGILGAWASLGFYTLKPGEAAVLILFGQHYGTVTEDGLRFTFPPPVVQREIVNVSEVQNQDFGMRGEGDAESTEGGTPAQATQVREAAMQTSDNNIVHVSFSVQYQIKDAFQARFRLADVNSVVRAAAQASMREAVGRMTVDGVLRERRAALTAETAELMQAILDSYDSGLDIDTVQLQDVQPPTEVQAAFADVIAANQDANRLVNEAEGFRNEKIPNARGEASELLEQAYGYRDAKIAEAEGEANRFSALLAEYKKAPEVTKKRLYLETMESVLPRVQKVIIEQGTTSVLPYLPLGRAQGGEKP